MKWAKKSPCPRTSEMVSIFKHMAHYGILHVTSEWDALILHYMCQPQIAMSLEEFTVQWNYYGIKTVGHGSPLTLCSHGIKSPEKTAQIISSAKPVSSHGWTQHGSSQD